MYNHFSYVYDYFMDNIPYDEWFENILDIFDKYNFNPKTILDLGCGTGELTSKFAKKGYLMVGIDLSEHMINVAKQKNEELNVNVIYQVQDMTTFNLSQKVDCMISTCDSYNYVLDDNDLQKSFKKVYEYLNNGGMFIFDMNTENYFKNTLGECTYSDIALDSAYIVENNYDEKTKINNYELNLFTENKDGSYLRSIEIHKEKARSIDEVKKLLNNANLKCVEVLDTETLDNVDKETDRMYFVCIKE